ncbi:hypothetical protein F5Y00DRAFT_271136 [Daldinia vernicosa]|uniref:uncharacterized protein n=1 Tax=Daldinia vernicosa TaxID=114800 RepID=UPI002008DE70|nr:uncharacterized protein F5Y00DRAFT_271136 [Daldinia vernicosa]KAI0847397.1 hypothetical protein F5Y00DRAFT_271136 [Daldinia vernicosa]
MSQSKEDKVDDKVEEKIENVKSKLPLPEEPPVSPDWNTADARPVAVGSGRVEDDISYGEASTSGLRQPASKEVEVDLSGVGRQGKDDLERPPKDAKGPRKKLKHIPPKDRVSSKGDEE